MKEKENNVKKKKYEPTILDAILYITVGLVIALIIIGYAVFKKTLVWGDGLLSYAGAIIGGGITLFGVALTIYYQDVKRKEDLIIQYKPLLTITPLHSTDLMGLSIQSNFMIQNNGRGEATDIKIETLSDNSECILQNLEKTVIEKNGNLIVHIALCKNKDSLETFFIDNDTKLNFTIIITYYGAFGNKYHIKSNIVVEKTILLGDTLNSFEEISSAPRKWISRIIDTKHY